MIDKKELAWWKKEYPELDDEDIIMVLELFDDEAAPEGGDSFSKFVEPKKPGGLRGILGKILDRDD